VLLNAKCRLPTARFLRVPHSILLFVESQDMFSSLSRDILYGFGCETSVAIQRSTIVERWIARSSSRIKLLQ